MTFNTIILEKKAAYTDHDRLFKELIQTFFQEFMEAFFPNEHDFIDFSTVTFLDQEVFTDILKGEKRRIDILAETKHKGKEEIILIHIEPQAAYQKEFHERMFIYCSRLYEKFRKPIIPIAVFSYDDKREVPSNFTIDTPTLQIITFNYLQLHLVKVNWRKYIEQDNPAAAALLSKMGYTHEERAQVKMEFLRMLARMELNPAKMELLYGFFETYLKLNDEEEKEMNEEISKLPKEEADRVLELPNSYRERGRVEGIEIGETRGRAKGIELGEARGTKSTKKQLVCNMLRKGTSHEYIAEVAEIDVHEVEKIRKELEN